MERRDSQTACTRPAPTGSSTTSWKLTRHALDVMTGMLRSGESGKMVGFKARSVIGGYWMKVFADKLAAKK